MRASWQVHQWGGTVRTVGAAVLALVLSAWPVVAQVPRDTLLAAGPEYEAGRLRATVLGRHHRELWTTPMRVGLLDLDAFAGGLKPVRRGGGFQTRSLRLQGRDGKEYTFRSVNKDPSAVLDSLLRGTVVDALVQDGISAAHPVGALVAAPLLEAAGVLHVAPLLAVLPDSPLLGDFREDFAGVLGLLEEHPDEREGGGAAFAGASRVAGSEALLEKVTGGIDDFVDVRAYLTARLMDVFMGDWDRHRDQWRWATFDTEAPRRWLPIPRDRDQAFSHFDGLAMDMVRVAFPQFVRFSSEYPSLVRLHWSARELDRLFLPRLDGAAWDSVAISLQHRLTDAALADAVSHLPPELRAVHGSDLTATLRARRDGLLEAARDFYRLMAQDVDLRLTDASEDVRVDRSARGVLFVEVRGRGGDAPYLRRRFIATETEEVRIHLRGGRDVVHVLGEDATIPVRLITGKGQDTVVVDGRGSGVTLHDAAGSTVLLGDARPKIDTRAFREWVWSEEDRDQPRDWGDAWLPLPRASFSSDTGVLLGAGVRRDTFGFRTAPFATRISFEGGWAPSFGGGEVAFSVRRNRSNSPVFVEGRGRGSSLEVLHYYGVGNDTPGGDRDTRRVDVTTWMAEGRLGAAWGTGLEASAGVRFQRSEAGPNEGRYFNDVRESLTGGSGAFQDVAFFAGGAWSGQAGASALWGSLDASVSPQVLDAAGTFGDAALRFGLHLTPHPDAPVSLVVRGGARKVWGPAPWTRKTFLGGGNTLRGWAGDRFSGDGSIFGSTEVLVRLGYPQILVPVETGIFVFGDAGRVFLEGASPGGWHGSLGGGLWLKPFGQPNTLRLGAGRSEEGVRFYGSLGLPWR